MGAIKPLPSIIYDWSSFLIAVINGVPLQPEALPPGPGAMILSPGGGIAHSMALMPNSPCLHPNTVGGGGGGGGGAGGSSSSSSIKSKSGRSSTHSNGGSRKRSSPIPNSGTGGSTAKKTHQFMLVAAEAVPLKDAGIVACRHRTDQADWNTLGHVTRTHYVTGTH